MSAPRLHRLAPAIALAAIVGLSCFARKLTIDLSRVTTDLGRYTPERRLALYQTMNEAATLAFRLGRKLHRDVVAAAPMPDGKATLELASLHGGGRPDQFALVPPHPARPGATEDFGYLFDVDGDGRFDWIVFNGGPLFDRDFKHMLWMNYHFVDTNGDGRVDVMVFNDVDLDGDRSYDEDVTAWLYDRDFDGTFDEGEYLGPFGSRPVPRSGDDLVLALALGEKRISTRDPAATAWISGILGQINAATTVHAAATTRR